MELLENQLRKNGFNYKQVHSADDFYIYAQHLDKKSDGSDKLIAYEVFEKKIIKARELEWGSITEHEAFPSDEAFGVWAFSVALFDRTEQECLTIAIEKGEIFKQRKENKK